MSPIHSCNCKLNIFIRNCFRSVNTQDTFTWTKMYSYLFLTSSLSSVSILPIAMLLISLNVIHSTLYLQCNASMPDSIDNRTNKYQIPALPTAAPDHGSSNSFSANHPSLRRLRALRSHVGAFIVLCSHYVHSDHWPLIQCTAP